MDTSLMRTLSAVLMAWNAWPSGTTWYVCDPDNSCCNQTGMPCFYRNLAQEGGDEIEVRLCANEGVENEEVFVVLVEIFVQ